MRMKFSVDTGGNPGLAEVAKEVQARALYRSFSSSERLVGILSPIVEPPTARLIGSIADYFHCRWVRPKPVGYN